MRLERGDYLGWVPVQSLPTKRHVTCDRVVTGHMSLRQNTKHSYDRKRTSVVIGFKAPTLNKFVL